MEIWKDIEGYEGYYQISNLGRVKSLKRVILKSDGKTKTIPERIRATHKDHLGYERLCLQKDGKQELKKIHRLVAIAFIPNPDNLPVVNHKDENPSNNKVDNLEWCTQKYNSNYGTRNEKLSLNHTGLVSKRKLKVKCIETGIIYDSLTEAAISANVSITRICSVCKGKRKTTGGYHWEYVRGNDSNE